MRDMLEAGLHFGHQARYWNPKMAPYLYGQRNRIHIINLEKTLPLYREALAFLGRISATGAMVLFVGTKRVARSIVEEEAKRCNMPYVNQRWLGGLLTNYKAVRKSIERMRNYETMEAEGEFGKMRKKEALRYRRELDNLRRNFDGIRSLYERLPDALLVIDIGYEAIAIHEANRVGIPVVGIVDSNNDPSGVDYVIPGNDDSTHAVRLYLRGAADAILQARREEEARLAGEFTEVRDPQATARLSDAASTG